MLHTQADVECAGKHHAVGKNKRKLIKQLQHMQNEKSSMEVAAPQKKSQESAPSQKKNTNKKKKKSAGAQGDVEMGDIEDLLLFSADEEDEERRRRRRRER
ncbi:hypothetical protein F7725_022155 [Dissostichus mawsoni]|uniref:Uncharacterized protein n=1 Tax=Dissostichus mawsoni TaxID=36200 RepID=A0A7J5ZDP5_DISMA|nr:hypothetical protein F7725_022155 [Dissostichus mawsoni]